MDATDQKPKVGVGVLIFQDGKVLMGKRRGGLGNGEYGSLGGHVELLETLEDAIKREVMEESGLRIRNVKYLCTINMRKYAPKHYVDVAFTAEVESGEPKIMEPEKMESWGWYDLDNLPQPLFGVIPSYIEAYKTGKTFFEE